MSLMLIVTAITFLSVIMFCVCKNVILPWCRTAKRREILSKKKYKKLTKLTADTSTSVVHTYEDDEDDDVHIDAENQMILKRVEYSSRELEQLKLLDAAIDDDDVLDSDSLNFPENDNMDLTDNDEYVSMDEATTSVMLRNNPHKTEANAPQKSIFESDIETQNDNELQMVTTNVNTTNSAPDITANDHHKGENRNNGINVKVALNKKD